MGNPSCDFNGSGARDGDVGRIQRSGGADGAEGDEDDLHARSGPWQNTTSSQRINAPV
jgi:hypothetical protein